MTVAEVVEQLLKMPSLAKVCILLDGGISELKEISIVEENQEVWLCD